MRKKLILLFFLPFSLFSQNHSSLSIENFKKDIELNGINLQEIDTINESINNVEFDILKILNNSKEVRNKKIVFVSGSLGRTISTKANFFKSFIHYYNSYNRLLNYSIVELEQKEKEFSGVDVLVFFWTKTYNPKSKKLLKKIKQTKQT